MKEKYHITIEKATSGNEREIITFAVAWDAWKQAKRVYAKSQA